MKNFLFALVFLLPGMVLAQEPDESTEEVPPGEHPDHAFVGFNLGGKDYEMFSLDQEKSHITDSGGFIRIFLEEKGGYLRLSLTLSRSELKTPIPATVEVDPLNNPSRRKVDLFLVDRTREGRTFDKQILFTIGSITIDELTTNSVKMKFNGVGHVSRHSKQVKIAGYADVRLEPPE